MRATAKLLLFLLVASLALAACGGPKNDDRELKAACVRQNDEIAAEEEGNTPVAKSSEERTKAEHLNECAGQEKQMAAAAEGEDAPADGNKPADGEAPPTTPAKLDPAARDLFSQKCGVCHALSDAATTGAVGPDLNDTDFDADAVTMQIKNGGGGMPAGILEGDEATSVAGYVAAAAAAS